MLTQEHLKRFVSYDPETGIFRQIKFPGRRGRVYDGKIAGDAGGGTKKQYWRIAIDGQRYYAHQLAWLYIYGEWPDEIDHKDRNGHNNAISNLRKCTRAQNSINTKTTCASGFRGVYRCARNLKKPFTAKLKMHGKKAHLGYFETAEEAHRAYVEYAVKHFGEFADIHRLAMVV